MSNHALTVASIHSYPPTSLAVTMPAPPTPIPLGALPVVDGQPRRMSIPGQYSDPASAPQPTLVRLHPTRLLDLPRRLMHPPELPDFMQSPDQPQPDVHRMEGEAGGSGAGGRGRTSTSRNDDRHASGKKGKGKQPERNIHTEGASTGIVEEGRASGNVGCSPFYQAHSSRPPASQPSIPNSPGGDRSNSKTRRTWGRRWNWGIAPSFDVKLEDILQRKHLPPLGLKDFEEWLLFVEGCAENLYFILWLREYTTRYNAWTSSLKQQAQRAHASEAASAPFALSHPQSQSPNYPYGHHPASQQQQQDRTIRPQERPFASLRLAMSQAGLGADAPASPVPSHDDSVSGSASSMPRLGDTHPYRDDPAFPQTAASSSSLSGAGDLADDEDDEGVGDLGVHVERQRQRAYRTPAPAYPPNPALSLFYLRAKETFLTPNAPYELGVGSDVLAVFHTSTGNAASGAYGYMHPWATALGAGKLPPPPDPAVFAELAEIVERRLKGNLDRLVVATYNNVGMPRAYCGCGGGFVIGLIGSAPPLASSFALGGARWYRLLALPGMWLGMTIFISAWYGVCMMIYIFGDLRQLRSFELARPSISPQRPLSVTSGRDKGRDPRTVGPVPITRPPRPMLTIIPPDGERDAHQGPTASPKDKMNARWSEDTATEGIKASEGVPCGGDLMEQDEDDEDEDDDDDADDDDESDDDEPQIEISDAFYDEHPSPEGPATAPADWFPSSMSQPPMRETTANPLWPDYEGDTEENVHATAAFIGPYVYDNECPPGRAPRAGAGGRATDVEQPRRDASACQSLSEFDFDGLPPRKPTRPPAATPPAATPPVAAMPRRSSFATSRHDEPGTRVGRPVKSKARERARAKEEREKAKSRSRSPSPGGSSMNASLKARRWWSWWWWQFVEWVQTMCSPENAVDVFEKESHLFDECPLSGSGRNAPCAGEKRIAAGAPGVPPPAPQPPANARQPFNTRPRSNWREGLKKVYLAVPAFASPLTPVLNPLVGRAQWEIVVRSAAMAFVLSCIVVGSLLAVPE